MSEQDPDLPPALNYASPGAAKKKRMSALKIIVITLLSLLGAGVLLIGLFLGACLLVFHKK